MKAFAHGGPEVRLEEATQPRFPRSPFVGTNPTDEPMTSGVPVEREEQANRNHPWELLGEIGFDHCDNDCPAAP